MINIRFYKHGYIVEGHANSAPHGFDIVCSAVSTLALTGVEALTDLLDCAKEVRSGYLYVEYDGEHDLAFEAGIILDTIKTGLTLVANEYPKYVQLEEIE